MEAGQNRMITKQSVPVILVLGATAVRWDRTGHGLHRLAIFRGSSA
jgi:hypothetical protein